jgi:hypothetical protein
VSGDLNPLKVRRGKGFQLISPNPNLTRKVLILILQVPPETINEHGEVNLEWVIRAINPLF